MDFGVWILYFVFWILDFRVFGFSIVYVLVLDFGFCILELGFLDFVLLILFILYFWIFDFGVWRLYF